MSRKALEAIVTNCPGLPCSEIEAVLPPPSQWLLTHHAILEGTGQTLLVPSSSVRVVLLLLASLVGILSEMNLTEVFIAPNS